MPKKRASKGSTATKSTATTSGSSKADRVLGLPGTAGNQARVAVSDERDPALDQHKAAPVSKPSARLFTDTRSLMKKLEKHVNEEADRDVIKAASKALYIANPAYYTKFLIYKIEKHRDSDRDKCDLYTNNGPAEATWPLVETAWKLRSAAGFAHMFTSGWVHDAAKMQALAMTDPYFFVESGILDGCLDSDAGKQRIVEMVQERTFLDQFKSRFPGAYALMAASVPMLRLLDGVQKEVEDDIAAGADVSADEIVARVFDAFIHNRGMDLAYAGTKVDQNPDILVGQNARQKAQRAENQVKFNLPAKMSTACHELMHLLTTVLNGYPGLADQIVINGADEPTAVLTVPMSTLEGGLIDKGYAGNVFDAAGQPTGQIFFSGERAKISKSHSWLVINGVPYDPVLGTKGDAVTAAIAGKFEFNGDETTATEVGGTRVLKRETVKKTTGEYGLMAGWRLS